MMVPLIGDVDPLLGPPGERIAIKVSKTVRQLGRP
jgi:hypothetical protein